MANFVREAWREVTFSDMNKPSVHMLACCASDGVDSEQKHEGDCLNMHNVS